MRRLPEEEFIEALVAMEIGFQELIELDRVSLDERRYRLDRLGAVIDLALLLIPTVRHRKTKWREL